ncbi:hypothetical protein DFH09DRAFT_1471128 [Mycena vulgaris]|nr:hypothetical protein DFH09DRAFT_1471128 [Mycena vulgaris]
MLRMPHLCRTVVPQARILHVAGRDSEAVEHLRRNDQVYKMDSQFSYRSADVAGNRVSEVDARRKKEKKASVPLSSLSSLSCQRCAVARGFADPTTQAQSHPLPLCARESHNHVSKTFRWLDPTAHALFAATCGHPTTHALKALRRLDPTVRVLFASARANPTTQHARGFGGGIPPPAFDNPAQDTVGALYICAWTLRRLDPTARAVSGSAYEHPTTPSRPFRGWIPAPTPSLLLRV